MIANTIATVYNDGKVSFTFFRNYVLSHQAPSPRNADSTPVQRVIASITAKRDQFEEVREKLLQAALQDAPFDGWTAQTMARAARSIALDPADLVLIFPHGIADLLDYWAETLDLAMLTAMSGDDFATLKIREKVTLAVRARLEAGANHHEAYRRASATLFLPPLTKEAARHVWRTADRIWRALGDTSTDLNFYSKRSILSAVLTSTSAKWLADESDDFAETWRFLDDRIANVMTFEKTKAAWQKNEIDPGKFVSETLIPTLGKLRYPSGNPFSRS